MCVHVCDAVYEAYSPTYPSHSPPRPSHSSPHPSHSPQNPSFADEKKVRDELVATAKEKLTTLLKNTATEFDMKVCVCVHTRAPRWCKDIPVFLISSVC